MKIIVRDIIFKYNRANAKRALTIIDQLLQTLCIPFSNTSTTTGQAVPTAMNGEQPSQSYGIPGANLPSVDHVDFMLPDDGNGLQGLPHLDFDELWKTLNLGEPMIPAENTGELDWTWR